MVAAVKRLLLAGVLLTTSCYSTVRPDLVRGPGAALPQPLVRGRVRAAVQVTEGNTWRDQIGSDENWFLIFIWGRKYQVADGPDQYRQLLEQELRGVGFELAPLDQADIVLRAQLAHGSYGWFFMWLFMVYIPPFPLWGEGSPLLATEVELETRDAFHARRFKTYRVSAGRDTSTRMAATWRANAHAVARATAELMSGRR